MGLCKNLVKSPSCLSFLLLIIIGGLIQSNSVSADTTTPLPMYHQEMVYDSQNNQMIMFGGEISEGTSEDLEATWLFSSINLSWTKLTEGNSPGARRAHRMVYNSLTGKVLLFGGIPDAIGAQVNDTWEFDPSTNQWTELHPVNAPSARAVHGMYYDPEFNEVILHAGVHDGHTVLDDMWAYNFTSNNWYELHLSGGPGTGYGHSFVYDEINKVGVLFGGRYNYLQKNDIWLFNRSSLTWSQKIPTTKPLERYHHGMVYNPNDNTFIMFGGDNDHVTGRALDDTWIYNYQTNVWTEIVTSPIPNARCKLEMVFDPYLDRVILFGGVGEGFTVSYNDLWYYDPITMTWSQDATTNVPISTWIVLFSFVSIAVITHLSNSKYLIRKTK